MSTPAQPDADSVRAEARAWIQSNWDPDLSLVEWRRRLVDAGWATPSWPERWHGRDLPKWADDVVSEEIRAGGAVGLPLGTGTNLAAPTILAQGSDELRDRFLAPILTGEETWCQLFSEPGAGSDLAGLTTRAERDGDAWVINGQKVWNTSAHHADFGLLVARTDWDAPKHRGLTYFVIPMHQEGVEARPLRQMNNHASFNEVFMTDARIPHEYMVGQQGDGWRVALTTLAFERKFGSLARPQYGDAPGRALDEARAEAAAHFETYKWYPQRAGRVDLVVSRAQATGKDKDPVVRQEIARLLSMQKAAQWTADRARAARSLDRTPGPEGSIGKLANSDIARQASVVHGMISGADGMLTGADSPLDGVVAEVLISVPAQSIAGGTDQIQRNILSEKALGLPREPSFDKDKPFRDVPHNR
ncbi:alkylation response protein AidB-like acyl-CoA dehydrogenase [Antricoccus suffuscus]|uniref:Alkylation response protein AidB-like acyl-CoA dehydrogenase n=1 Tax=Antricoccus suffuscus TaxID=1629062 RepID=A0A2T1A643_9ACTN|nr:acyl-CoA dehydrogenase family protein [Antricoccus suffuscus]PRZ44056.1 alkylation response protein AidB-like acyl-CoA dehydrogenase [Antricoccus suffuscus]